MLKEQGNNQAFKSLRKLNFFWLTRHPRISNSSAQQSTYRSKMFLHPTLQRRLRTSTSKERIQPSSLVSLLDHGLKKVISKSILFPKSSTLTVLGWSIWRKINNLSSKTNTIWKQESFTKSWNILTRKVNRIRDQIQHSQMSPPWKDRTFLRISNNLASTTTLKCLSSSKWSPKVQALKRPK